MSSVFADTVSRQTILRFRDPQHGESDESDLLLREAYEKFEAPDQEHNSSGNRSKFETTIRAWERFWKREIAGGAADREPTIGEIDRICLRNFRDAIRQKISPTSTNIYCGYVKQILRKCGPPDSRNPEG
ncbi:MAG TPA: hypothetical protein VHX68_00795, partial [Planctomycetaceae bacterium]|nr:hypothetical protein [Planctomycetaceae bacterium]